MNTEHILQTLWRDWGWNVKTFKKNEKVQMEKYKYEHATSAK